MARALGILGAMGLTLAASAASAGPVSPAAPKSNGVELLHQVQVRDADVYFDGRGNRILVDRETGEVISVRPARPQRQMRRELRRSQPDDGFYENDARANARLRRQWEEEFGPLEDDGWSEFPGDRYAYPDEPAPRRQREAAVEPAPRRTPGAVTRAPLPAPGETTGTVPKTETIIANPPSKLETPPNSGAREDVAALQILLDRAGASPGAIDGRFGSNVDKAIVAYRALTGRNLKSTDTAIIKEQLAATGGDPFTTYTLTAQDVAGPFVASVPADYSAKAKLDRLSYTSVPEMLAERFHMDEKYLRALNPEANFSRVGTIIKVARVGGNARGVIARIVADKGNKQVRALDANGKLIVAYPATIGSAETPSPVGIHKVTRIAINPQYTYNPKINFKQGDNDKVLTIPPGPNGPVGSVWIALDKPTYGIHGTPDPSKIGKTESHGCIRLTNWDAEELTKIVKAGVPVEFLE